MEVTVSVFTSFSQISFIHIIFLRHQHSSRNEASHMYRGAIICGGRGVLTYCAPVGPPHSCSDSSFYFTYDFGQKLGPCCGSVGHSSVAMVTMLCAALTVATFLFRVVEERPVDE